VSFIQLKVCFAVYFLVQEMVMIETIIFTRKY